MSMHSVKKSFEVMPVCFGGSGFFSNTVYNCIIVQTKGQLDYCY